MHRQRFVILAAQRTGSTMLAEVLNSHPEITCHGELFIRPRVHDSGVQYRHFNTYAAPEMLSPRFSQYPECVANPREYLDEVVGISDPQSRFVGFKMMLNQDEAVLDWLLRQKGYRFVLLRRRNELAAYASAKLAAIRRGEEEPAVSDGTRVQAEFSEKEFQRFVKRRRRGFRLAKEALAANGIELFETDYLRICTDRGVAKVIEFLGADPALPFERLTEKINPWSVLDRFSNPEAAVACVSQMGRPEWQSEAV